MFLQFNSSSEILVEERSAAQETLKRENRRVAAMSWGFGDDIAAPPKPLRYPMQSEFDLLTIKLQLDSIILFFRR